MKNVTGRWATGLACCLAAFGLGPGMAAAQTKPTISQNCQETHRRKDHTMNRLTYQALLAALILSVGMPLAKAAEPANPDPYANEKWSLTPEQWQQQANVPDEIAPIVVPFTMPQLKRPGHQGRGCPRSCDRGCEILAERRCSAGSEWSAVPQHRAQDGHPSAVETADRSGPGRFTGRSRAMRKPIF